MSSVPALKTPESSAADLNHYWLDMLARSDPIQAEKDNLHQMAMFAMLTKIAIELEKFNAQAKPIE